MHIQFYVALFFYLELVSSSHFNGGTITWQPLDSNDTTSPIAIVITQTYSWVYSVVPCNQTAIASQIPINTVYNNNDVIGCSPSCSAGSGYTPVPVARYCISYSPSLGITSTQRSDIVQLSANASFNIAFDPASAAYWRPLQAVSSLTTTTASWSISCKIDLTRRTDNGLINTAPIANVISPVVIPINVPQKIVIPTVDANNDFVKCRWAQKSPIDECMNVCPPASLPAGVILSSNCTLYVTGTVNNSWYVAAIMVEDFVNSSSTQPLSAVPVQFLIHVVQSSASCAILPVVSGLNATHMTCTGAQTTIQYTSTLYATNYCGSGVTIVDISVQSFPGMVTGPLTFINSSYYSMSITWTPTSSQIGLQIMCAIGLDSLSQQSVQFCLIFSVGVGHTGACPGVPAITTTTTTTAVFITTSTTTITTTNTTTASTTPELETSSQAETTIETATSSIIPPTTTTTMEAFITTEDDGTTMNMASTDAITYHTSATHMLTSSVAKTTTIKASNGFKINVPLIVGLSLLAALLAISCCCCFCYYLCGGRRRRQKSSRKKHMKVDPTQHLLFNNMNRNILSGGRFHNSRISMENGLASHEMLKAAKCYSSSDLHFLEQSEMNESIDNLLRSSNPQILKSSSAFNNVMVRRIQNSEKEKDVTDETDMNIDTKLKTSTKPDNVSITRVSTQSATSIKSKMNHRANNTLNMSDTISAEPNFNKVQTIYDKSNVNANRRSLPETKFDDRRNNIMPAAQSVNVIKLARRERLLSYETTLPLTSSKTNNRSFSNEKNTLRKETVNLKSKHGGNVSVIKLPRAK